MMRGAIRNRGALINRIQHGRVSRIVLVVVGEGLREGPLHGMLRGKRRVVRVVVNVGGGFRPVRQDGLSAMHRAC
jgi:hypothetical protein